MPSRLPTTRGIDGAGVRGWWGKNFMISPNVETWGSLCMKPCGGDTVLFEIPFICLITASGFAFSLPYTFVSFTFAYSN